MNQETITDRNGKTVPLTVNDSPADGSWNFDHFKTAAGAKRSIKMMLKNDRSFFPDLNGIKAVHIMTHVFSGHGEIQERVMMQIVEEPRL